jgi:uncharacterized protein YciI
MGKIFLILVLLISLKINCFSQNPNYNKTLADSLGADDYGMKKYVLAILKTGSNQEADKLKLNELFKGHMENMGRLAEIGKLTVAGPFGKNDKNFRGLFILNVKTIDEARELIMTDPAINAQIFDVDLIEWYGSAALPMYLKSHSLIEKNKM